MVIDSPVEKIDEISVTLTLNNSISSELTEISENNFQEMKKRLIEFLN